MVGFGVALFVRQGCFKALADVSGDVSGPDNLRRGWLRCPRLGVLFHDAIGGMVAPIAFIGPDAVPMHHSLDVRLDVFHCFCRQLGVLGAKISA